MELIKITEQNGKQAVSARELHTFLDIETRFDIWIKRMFGYGFEENKDYETCSFLNLNNQTVIDYALSLDMSKEISMIQRSEKGKIARQYFLECEKKLKNPIQSISKIDLARMIIESETENQKLQLQIEEQAPKVLFTEAVIGSTTSCLIGELAKIICQNGFSIGQNRLFRVLREEGYLGRFGERKNIPNQRYLEQGLFELKKGIRTGKGGEMHHTTTTKVTGKGQVYFVNKFLSQENA